MNKLIFPSVLIVLDVAAAIVYLSHGDVRMCVYWTSASVLTASVTY
jgi:hypothetical protein